MLKKSQEQSSKSLAALGNGVLAKSRLGGRRGRCAKRGERRGRIQAGGKIANVCFHGGMPEAIEAEEIHFPHGLFGRPFFDGDAIGGGENAGAIIAEAAVHENFLPRLVVK